MDSSEGPSWGTLTDGEIRALASAGKLITEGFEPTFLRQACYELRAGTVYYDLADDARRIELDADHPYILVKPRQLIVVIVRETIDLPPDMLGRVLTKGHLFSGGLLPVNTYADPGFQGRLGIVLFNGSTHFLKLNPGEPIAKIEFCRLSKPVLNPYHGQHGYQTKIWPIPTEMIMTPEEVSRDDRILSPDKELLRSYGPEIGQVVWRISQYHRRLTIASCMYFTFILVLLVLISRGTVVNLGVGVAVGILANVLTGFLTYGATDFGRRRRFWPWRNL